MNTEKKGSKDKDPDNKSVDVNSGKFPSLNEKLQEETQRKTVTQKEVFKQSSLQEAIARTAEMQKVFSGSTALQEAIARTAEMQKVFSGSTALQEAIARTAEMQKVFSGGTALQEAIARITKMQKQLNKPTVFTDQLIKQLSLVNPESELPYLARKISKADVHITNSYNEEEESLEYALENHHTEEKIPLEEFKATLGVIDIIKGLTLEEVISFYNYLTKYPMLGLEHPVGQRIYEEIDDVPLTKVQDVKLFRVRDRNIAKRELPYSSVEMFNAPHGYSGNGRFNAVGHGELYTCTDKAVAFKEVAYESQEVRYEIIKWELENPVDLIDLSNREYPLAKYCSFKKQTPNAQEYLIPNFIAQCAKKKDISGVIFQSVHHDEAINYVFFKFNEEWFKELHLYVDIKYEDIRM